MTEFCILLFGQRQISPKNCLTTIEQQVLECISGKAFSLHYTEISSVRCSMMKSIQAVSSLNPQSPRLAGHIQEMGEYFCASSQNFEKYSPTN